jgi:hypothetical protein
LVQAALLAQPRRVVEQEIIPYLVRLLLLAAAVEVQLRRDLQTMEFLAVLVVADQVTLQQLAAPETHLLQRPLKDQTVVTELLILALPAVAVAVLLL